LPNIELYKGHIHVHSRVVVYFHIEFFTVPEIFQNSNHYPLGTTQKGVNIDNVGLPPWAKGSAYEFVRVHRLALESEYVSCNLQNWIDLVFGYKQRGLEAEKAWNGEFLLN